MTTSTTEGQQLPVLDDLDNATIRSLIAGHLGVTDYTATKHVRAWAIGQGLMRETAVRGPMARAAWLAYAEAHRIGVVQAPPPAEPAAPTATRCKCAHLRIDHRGGERCGRAACGCLRFRRH